MADQSTPYREALRFSWLTRHYDRILDFSVNDRRFKEQLVLESGILPHHRVLDFGCGTGSLTLQIKERYPTAQVMGLDIDERILRLAESKARARKRAVIWYHGALADLAAEIAPVDRIVSSLVFHHLTTSEKRETLRQLVSILAPDGEIHIADFGKPRTWLMRTAFLGVRVLDGFDRTEANALGQLPTLMAEAGLVNVHVSQSFSTLCGSVELFHGSKAG